jgi:predicted ATPase/class 3 adenylate cyclase
VNVTSAITTYLFTDIEGSTRLWEQEPERMRGALARHDAITRKAVESAGGTVVKMTGDGVHATFDDPLRAVNAALALQQALSDAAATEGIALRVRCGVHAGVDERRDSDFFGRAVNRAARIMSAAHGGQVLISQAVAVLVGDRLPAGVTLRDLGGVRLRDLSNPERVYQVVHPGLRRDFPALRSLEATPNNLPLQLTSFIGRENEVADVKRLLRENRLLTLVGVGGIGKTRLSLQVAADVMDNYPDGVWFVELAPVTDGRLVVQALASVLGVKEEAGRSVLEALVKYVKDRRLLIILDNCEHLIAACAELAKQLLQAGGHVRILASSREHLHIAGEATYLVPALAAPDPYQNFMHTALTEYAAARLFVDRAIAAQPAFELSQQNAVAVADVCHRLDGIPLAIELAAARVRSISVEEIAARLTDRFRLLARGDRTALPRQQTLRALIDWSYDLLTEHERALFRRLAVFAGGWTLGAAEAVGADGIVPKTDVLDLLTNLAEKSLVAIGVENDRYRLLETVRQYAHERLHESGEEDEVRGRHLDYYLAFAERAGTALAGPEEPAFLKQLDLELENILAAHAFCVGNDERSESGYRLVHGIKLYWFTRGLLNLGHRVTVEALSMPRAPAPSLQRCKALWVAGQIASSMGRYAEAQGYLLESLDTARALQESRLVVSVLNTLAHSALGQGDRAAARRHSEQALELASKLGNKRGIATAANALAQIHRLDGQLDAAEPLYARTAALASELGDREVAAVAHLNLAMVAIQRGAAARARSLLLEVLNIAKQTGSRRTGQSVLEVSAGLAALGEDWERAARFYGVAERQTTDTGMQRDPADDAFLQPWMSKARNALGQARFDASLAAGLALNYEGAIDETQTWLARLN